MYINIYIWALVCMSMKRREKRQYGFSFFIYFLFLVAEEKGGERTYDTTGG